MNNKIKIIKNIMNTTIITKELIDPTIKINKKKIIKGFVQPIKKQQRINEETGVYRCIGGCGKRVLHNGGMCGVAGGVPACQH